MKRFRTHEDMSHLEVYARMKNCCLCCLMLAYICFVSWFLLVRCEIFCARKISSSRKKKKNRFGIVLITSLYYTTSVYPYQPTYREFICTHLFLFVIVCENLFFLWKFFWISSYLWSSVRIYFLKISKRINPIIWNKSFIIKTR